MAINLKKNSTISLEKAAPQLSSMTIGLGWDVAQADAPKGFWASLFGAGKEDIDLDASCVLLDERANVIDIAWFHQLRSQCGAVKHHGDNLTGAGEGDDEQITIELKKLPKSVKHLAITVNSYSGQSFNEIENAFCRVMDQTDTEICRYTLTEQGTHTGVLIGLLSKENNEWSFTSKGEPMSGVTVKNITSQLSAHILAHDTVTA